MLILRLQLLAEDRAGFIEGLQYVVQYIESATSLDSYSVISAGAFPQFLLEAETTEAVNIEDVFDDAEPAHI